MELLQNAPFVRLRSCHRGLYLAADENKREIFLSGGRAAANTVWGVHIVSDDEGEPYVLFKSIHGRYLFATDVAATIGPPGAVTVGQVTYSPGNRSPMPSMIWKALRREEDFILKNSAGLFLRANGKYLKWRKMVTVAGDNSSKMMLWTIIPIDLEHPSSLDAASQAIVRRLIIAKIAQKESSKQKLEAKLHGSSRRGAELQAEGKRLQKIDDACLLSWNTQQIEFATRTRNALSLKIAVLQDDIDKLHERKRQLEQDIRRTRPPRRWSW